MGLLVALLTAVPLGHADAAKIQKGYLKRSVAAFAEPDRSKYLSFLNESRKVSDVVANTVTSGDFAAAGRISTPAAVTQLRQTAQALRESLPGGKRPLLQYRNQALELVGAEETRTSRVWYGVVSGSAATRHFVSVVVGQAPSGGAARVIAVAPLSYPEVPPWLQRVDAGMDAPKR